MSARTHTKATIAIARANTFGLLLFWMSVSYLLSLTVIRIVWSDIFLVPEVASRTLLNEKLILGLKILLPLPSVSGSTSTVISPSSSASNTYTSPSSPSSPYSPSPSLTITNTSPSSSSGGGTKSSLSTNSEIHLR